MKKLLLCLLFFISQAWATTPTIALERAPIDSHDMASIQRGAKFFATQCMMCHTLKYLRYDDVAKKAGVLYEKMPIEQKAWPFGVQPPDLSLEIKVRGADWVYTYLHSFYLDPSRPTGANNLLLPNAVMPNILLGLQGENVLLNQDVSTYHFTDQVQWYDILKRQTAGTLTPEQFDATITDLVNFLDYASEPHKNARLYLGWWVLGFLFVFFILLRALKKEYWKDIQKHK